MDLSEAEPFDPTLPDRIGVYRIVRKIGEGGMGEVYQAEQVKPVRRRVALKVIKHGMDTKRVVARFEAERQALALMDHPCLAKVFEAGTAPSGRPYFVMEFVDGVPITEHCDRQKLSVAERLNLFLKVCDGVQHAHRRAIIHRDIKPSNVLVTIRDGAATPKIIDFGLAKAMTRKLTEKTMFTELGVLIGTPEYMSPEQAEGTGEDVDTRTDVYSLGVLLYELLVGTLPLDSESLRSAGYEEIRKRIREEDPPKPSTRLTTLGDDSTESAQSRRTDLPSLQKQLRGDLDWITMRALEKDRSRRYGSPEELAADIGRYLANEPVLASPPSATYRARKFVRRHRLGVSVAAAALLVLSAFAVTFVVQADRIARERDQVALEAETSARVVEFLTGLFEVSDPRESRGDTITARELLDEGARKLKTDLVDQPLVRARMLASIGQVYRGLALHDEAESLLDQAIAIQREALGEEHPETLTSMHAMARVYSLLDRDAEAEMLERDVLETRMRVLGTEHPDTLRSMFSLAGLIEWRGKVHEAETLYVEAIDTAKRVLDVNDPDYLDYVRSLGSFYSDQGRHEEADALLLENLERTRRTRGADHPDTIDSMSMLGNHHRDAGNFDEAERRMAEVVELSGRVYGDRHPQTIDSKLQLAVTYQRQGKLDDAEQLFLEALGSARQALGVDARSTLGAMSGLADLYRIQGRYDEAETAVLEVLDAVKAKFGEAHPASISLKSLLATIYRNQRRYDEAETLQLETLEARRRIFGEDHPSTLTAMNGMASFYHGIRRYEDAEDLFSHVVERRKKILGEDHPDTLVAMNNLAATYDRLDRYEDADALNLEVLEARRRTLGADHPDTLTSMHNLAISYKTQNRLDEAEEIYLETLEGRRRVLGAEHPRTIRTLRDLARVYEALGRNDEEERFLLELLEVRRNVLGRNDQDTLATLTDLANFYLATGTPEQARPYTSELLAFFKSEAEAGAADATAKNTYARSLLTYLPEDLRDPQKALEFALQANELTGFEDSGLLDTLALAYHRTGRTDEAIATQKKAIRLLPEDDDEGRRELREHLAEFEAEKR